MNTQVMMQARLKWKAAAVAKRKGKSLSDYLRDLITAAVANEPDPEQPPAIPAVKAKAKKKK